MEKFTEQENDIGAVSFKGIMGNPCIFSYKYKNELENLSGDTGGKKVIKNHMENLWKYEIFDEKEIKDIDYQQDINY